MAQNIKTGVFASGSGGELLCRQVFKLKFKGTGWGIGQTLRKRREQLRMNLDDLGARSGLHPTIISRVERGERRATAEFLIKLAPALRFSYLLLGIAGAFVIGYIAGKIRG